jgi:hypothetical protein
MTVTDSDSQSQRQTEVKVGSEMDIRNYREIYIRIIAYLNKSDLHQVNIPNSGHLDPKGIPWYNHSRVASFSDTIIINFSESI